MAMRGGSLPPCAPPESVAVFIDSNLDTHLAMLVSTAETVADLKRNVSTEHALCFPHIGEITVHAVKVKRKGAYYHLSDSMFVRNAFNGVKGTWFLHVDLVEREIKHQEQAAGNFVNENEWLEGDHQLHSNHLQIVVADRSQGLAVNMQLDRRDISQNDAEDVLAKQNRMIDDVELPVDHHIHTEKLWRDEFGINNSELDKEMEVQQPKCQSDEMDMPCSMPKDELIVEHVNRDIQYDSEVPNIGTNNVSDSAGPRMKEKFTKRINVSQHHDLMDRNSPHISFDRKLRKKDKGASHEESNQECRTGHDIQGAPSSTETSKMDMTPLEVDGKNGASLTGEPKKKKKKRTSKSQNEAGSTIPSTSVTDLPETTVKHNDETELCSHSHREAEVTVHEEDPFLETKNQDLEDPFIDIQGAPSSTETSKLDVTPLEVDGKNGASLTGEPKKKKKKRTSKSQNEAGSTIPSISVTDLPETTVKHNAETELCSHSHREAELTVHEEDPFIETKNQDLEGQSKVLTEESGFTAGKIMRDVPKDLMGVISDNISVDKFDNSTPVHQFFAESRLSNNASENLSSQKYEADKFEVLIPKGSHKEVNAAINTNRECIPTAAAEVGSAVQNESLLEKKKRKKSSKTSASATLVVHTCESVPEENLKEVPKSGKKGMLSVVDGENIGGEAYNSNYYVKLDSKDALDSIRGEHISEIKEHENMRFPNLQSDDLKSNYSLKDQDTEEKCKEKLEDKGLQGHASLVEMGALNNNAMDCVVATITKVKKSHQKKKRSATELKNDGCTNHQEFLQPLVNGTDDGRIELMTLKPNLLEKEPKLVSNVGEAVTTVYRANEDLTVNSKVDNKRSQHRKRKSVKLNGSDVISYNDLDKQNIPGSLSKASGTSNDSSVREVNILSGSMQDVSEINALSSFSNSTNNDIGGKKEDLERAEVDLPSEIAGSTTCKISLDPLEVNINFKDYFIPKSSQHESVISVPQLSSEETEPRKQQKRKSERKRKLDIKSQELNHLHNSTKECMLEPDHEDPCHDLNLADPLIQSSTSLMNNEEFQNDAVERIRNSSMQIGIPYDTKVKKKKKVENYEHDSHHKISSPQKIQAEKIAFSKKDKSLNNQDTSDAGDLKYHDHAKPNSGTRNTELHIHTSQGTSSYASDGLQEDAVANLAASSDSTEESPMQTKRFMMAVGKKPTSKSTATSSKSKPVKNDQTPSRVRKKPTSKFTMTSSKSKQEKTLLAPSGTIFNHATIYNSEDEFENGRTPSPDSSSTSVDSDQGLDSLAADADSAAFHRKDEIDGEILLSQSKKGMPLDSILRSSSIYKKAKVLASQSQAEESESQPEAAVSLHEI